MLGIITLSTIILDQDIPKLVLVLEFSCQKLQKEVATHKGQTTDGLSGDGITAPLSKKDGYGWSIFPLSTVLGKGIGGSDC